VPVAFNVKAQRMPILYLVALLAYVLLIVVWLWLEKLPHRARRWVAFLAIASAAPFFTVVGGFLGTFSNNICYSRVVAAVADLPGTYARAGNTDALAAMSSLANKLPLRGYETDCNELSAAVESLKFELEQEWINAKP
jgi:hypothetical protein